MLVKLQAVYQKLFQKNIIVNESQTDLSLGYTHISFDASVMPNGYVGIGMHDITNKTKKHGGGKVCGFSSAKGEMAALMFTLDYAKEKNLTRLNLYTDNLKLATKNNKKLYAKYNFIDVKLTWVPRELNTSADKLSKEGQKVNKIVTPSFIGPSANQTKKVKIVKKSKESRKIYGKDLIGPVEPEKIEGTLKLFRDWSYNKKVTFLSKLATNDRNEVEFIRMVKVNGGKADYKFSVSNANITFIRMAKTLLVNDPKISAYTRKRLKGLKDPRNNQGLQNLSFEKFEKEFDIRKPKNITNIENTVERKAA